MAKHKKGSRGIEEKGIGNFQYERHGNSPGMAPRPAASRRNVDPVVLKRAYMLQNFQFLLRRDVQEMKTTPVLPQGLRRLKEALTSSDAAPPWDAVTAVVVRWTVEEFSCPICLEVPAVARIADCGHVFCLPCMLQYLSRRKAENKQRTCPVCHNFVTLGMLRPCILRPIELPCVGKSVNFTLLKRRGGSCVLLRQDDHRWSDQHLLEDELPFPSQNEPSATFSRYILATAESEERQRRLDCVGIMDQINSINSQPRPLTQFDDEVLRFSEETLALVLQDGTPQTLQTGFRNSPPIAPKRPETDVDATYDLYAESNGQPYYLHPMTFKMLREDAAARGSSLLNTVEAPVEEIVTFTQDEASRKQYKAFSHVPLHGTVKLCLLDLSDVVMPATLLRFAVSLEKMREARRRRDADGDGDSTWRAYLRRYAPHSQTTTRSPDFAPSDFALSDYSGGSEPLPSLELPSSGVTASSEPGGLSGDSPVDTRQRATKRHDNPITSCWSAESSRRLFSTPPARPAVPTWGGHAFNPHKPSSTVSRTDKQGRK